VVCEHAEHTLEVSAVHDQEPVEALCAGGLDEALGDGVGERRRLRSIPSLMSGLFG